MPVSIGWDEVTPDTLHITFDGVWTWEEYYHMDDTFGELLAARAHERVDIIVDFSNSGGIPGGIFTHFRRSTQSVSPNIEMVVLVGVGDMLRSILSVLSRVTPYLRHHVSYSHTIEDARRRITRNRSGSSTGSAVPARRQRDSYSGHGTL
jgi:hypothetical protein